MAKALLLILGDVLASVAGQLCLKLGMTQVGPIGLQQATQPWPTLVRIFTTPFILAAIPLYIFAFALWLVVLSRLRLSFAYPFISLTYVLVPIASWLLLGEPVPALRWMGIGVIMLGIIVVGRS